MDRLEEIKKNIENADNVNIGVVYWLVTEIERLRKEKEWLIVQYIEREIQEYDYGWPEKKAKENAREEILLQMQQALKEK